MSSRLRAIAKARALHVLARRTDKEHEAAAAKAAAEEIERRYRLTHEDTSAVEVDALLHMLGVPGDGRRVWPLGLLLVLTNHFGTTPKVKSVDSYGVVDDRTRESSVLRTCELHRDLRLEVARKGYASRLYGMGFVHGLASALEDPFVQKLEPTSSAETATGSAALVPADFASEEARAAWDEIGRQAAQAAPRTPEDERDVQRGFSHGQRVGNLLLRQKRLPS